MARPVDIVLLAAAAILVLHGPAAADSPPETVITQVLDEVGNPLSEGNLTLSTSLTFHFTGTDDVGITGFECSLDGAVFAPCASPATEHALAVGEHDFAVRAVDTAEQRDATPALVTVLVELAPEATITSAIDGRGSSIPNGGTTKSHRITFHFTGTDNGGIAGFECSLDQAYVFAPCASPVTFERLRRGPHTFRLQAIDNHGIRSATQVFVWGIR